MTDSLTSRVLAFIEANNLINPGDIVVVAVSGGADSLCLLSLLIALAPLLECSLHVAHLDHGMRATSAADAVFVAELSSQLQVPVSCGFTAVAALAREKGLSIETAARLARYEFLRDVAALVSARTVATGHTRDDQAETLLLHLIRGSGLAGLVGMHPKRGDIIRPMLQVSHTEAVTYCMDAQLPFREDETNRSIAFTRNRLRHEVMPRLQDIQPAAIANMARAMRLVSADLAYIERMARVALNHCVALSGRTQAIVNINRFAKEERELWPHMLRLLIVLLIGNADGYSESDYVHMLSLLSSTNNESKLHLPKGLVLKRHGQEARIGPTESMLPALQDVVLSIPGEVVTDAGTLSAAIVLAPESWDDADQLIAYLNPLTVGSVLTVRAWRPGDRIHPLGMEGIRKVQDVFTDLKVPREDRQRIPIVEGATGLAWVAGLMIGHDYRAHAGSLSVQLTWRAVSHEQNH